VPVPQTDHRSTPPRRAVTSSTSPSDSWCTAEPARCVDTADPARWPSPEDLPLQRHEAAYVGFRGLLQHAMAKSAHPAAAQVLRQRVNPAEVLLQAPFEFFEGQVQPFRIDIALYGPAI